MRTHSDELYIPGCQESRRVPHEAKIQQRALGVEKETHTCAHRHVGMKAEEALQPFRACRCRPVSDSSLKQCLYIGGAQGTTKAEVLPRMDAMPLAVAHESDVFSGMACK